MPALMLCQTGESLRLGTSYMQIPYWAWQEKQSEIARILVENSSSKELKFIWPLIKEDLRLCNCVISSSKVEISPHAIPIHMIPCIGNADRKIFMTATLVDDSILSSHFGIDRSHLVNAIVPDSAGDIGDRMILFPQALNTNTTDDDIKAYCKWFSGYENVVVIVPSGYRANFWRDAADEVLDKNNLYEGIERLKKDRVGLTILINRYDGIDLPGNACRLLVIDGFPDVRRLIDKVKQGALMGSDREMNQVLQRVEQGMGRGIRSNDDYCIVFLMGKDLTGRLYSRNAINKLSPGTEAQLRLSEQLSEQIRGTNLADITDTLSLCLGRASDWVTASKGVLASLKYPDENQIDTVTVELRKAYDLASSNALTKAVETIQSLVNTETNQALRGYLKQCLAEYLNLQDKVEAQKIQLAAATDNRRLLKPIEGIGYHKLKGDALDQAIQCSKFITARYNDPNKLIIDVDSILSDLQFEHISAARFEEAIKRIAKYIGFDSQRPESDYKKGPDNLWSLGNLVYCVIECKNQAVTPTICKGDCNQLNGSCKWFENKYDANCSYTPIMIHNSNLFEYAATPHQDVRIICQEDLTKFKTSVREFIKGIALSNEIERPEAIRGKLMGYKLLGSDFISSYTRQHRIKNQP